MAGDRRSKRTEEIRHTDRVLMVCLPEAERSVAVQRQVSASLRAQPNSRAAPVKLPWG